MTTELTTVSRTPAAPDEPPSAPSVSHDLRGRRGQTLLVALARAGIVLTVLGLWEFLPRIPWLTKRAVIFDSFFVSSPSRVAERIGQLATSGTESDGIWLPLWNTLQGTILGVLGGVTLGVLLGLLFSNSPRTARILSPFIVMLNAIPRIALIPIIVIIFGASLAADAITAGLIVFFLAFYNAFSGGRSVPDEVLQNARLLGASPYEQMREVRFRFVLVWATASLPNAISFGLLGAVTTEIISGRNGVGRLLNQSIANADATLTFSVVVILAGVGVFLVTLAQRITGRLLHWWSGGGAL